MRLATASMLLPYHAKAVSLNLRVFEIEEGFQGSLERVVRVVSVQRVYVFAASRAVYSIEGRFARLYVAFRQSAPAVVARGTAQSQQTTLAERAEAMIFRRAVRIERRAAVFAFSRALSRRGVTVFARRRH